MSSYSGIYKITNLVNQKVYIGSAIDIKKRWQDHLNYLRKDKHNNKYLQRSYNKYGEDAFEFKILFYCYPDKLLHYEQTFIDFYKFKVGWDNMYNMCPLSHSTLGRDVTQETKNKISIANKGRKHTLEAIQNMSQGMLGNQNAKGFKQTKETCDKRGKILKGKKRSPEQCTRISKAKTGFKHTAQSCANMSKAQKGVKHKPCTQETKDKIRITLTGRKLTEEHKAKISEGGKGKKRPPRSDEWKKKQSLAQKGKSWSKKRREIFNKRHNNEE